MNNRKQTNKRGKNPRQFRVQTIVEPKFLDRFDEETGMPYEIPNPRYGITKKIVHKN